MDGCVLETSIDGMKTGTFITSGARMIASKCMGFGSRRLKLNQCSFHTMLSLKRRSFVQWMNAGWQPYGPMWSSDRVSAQVLTKRRSQMSYANSQARGFHTTKCQLTFTSSKRCLALQPVRFSAPNGEKLTRARVEGRMITRMTKRSKLGSAVAITSMVVSLAVVAFGQQGWAKLQTIKTGSADSGINSVYYDGDDIWVVGSHGLIARSHDDGQTFQEMNQGIDTALNDIWVRKDRICMVGDAGTILRSTDGGRSFVKILRSARRGTPGASGDLDLYSVQYADDDHAYIVGDRGLILFSSDGGASWREQHSGSDAQLFHLSFRGERGWVVGTGGVILHTDNGGKNWYPQRPSGNDDLNRVYMITDKVGLITGDNGTLLRTENAGATWERVPLTVREPLFGLSFIDNKTGWVVGYKGRIIRTYDGGRNWVEQTSNTGADLFAVSFRKNRGYAIGRDGLVMRYYEKR